MSKPEKILLVLTVCLATGVAGSLPSGMAYATIGDLDGNCKVDWWDLDIFAGYWLANPGGIADLNGDGKVNISDFTLLSDNWLEGGREGSLQVAILPQEAIEGGARWRVDGGGWQSSGSIVSCLPVGSHSVDFSNVSGWTEPNIQTVQIDEGKLTVFVGTYVQQRGSLKVNIAPQAAINGGARWRVDGGAWQTSGTTVSNLPADTHTVEFSAVEGWTKPADRIVIINDNQTTTITGTYVQPLVISEFMAVNDNAYPNPENQEEFWDWIEIYNPSDASVDLTGWSLKYMPIGETTPTVWQFPSMDIDAGAFLVVFASELNRRDPAHLLHTNFKLRGSGAYLHLVAGDGVTVAHEYVPYPLQLGDISYGLAQYAQTLVATGALAYYYVPVSGDAGKNWTAVGFSETGWKTGKTAIGFMKTPQRVGQDIGNPSAAGSFSLNNGVYTINGDGGDIWYEADAFYYVYAPLKGDGELTARVASMTGTDPWAKAGVMIRETLDASSKHAMTVVTPANGTAFQWRTDTAGGSNNTNSGSMTAPYWVRIKRTDNTFTGSVSSNGIDWTQRGETIITMAQDVYIGMCVTSHSDGVLCTAVFDNVSDTGDIATDVKTDMKGINATLWTRMKFNLEEGQADLFDRLTLRVKYEDGFAAFLNGQKVASRNAPATLLWNSTADSNRPNEQSSVFESISITEYKSYLQTGTNVLAIQALNDNKNDGEFLILPELTGASDSSIPQYFTTSTPWTYNISGAQDICDDVFFSVEHGFYDIPFTLTLCTDETGAEIRYTLDGSRPTITHGSKYTAPILIYKTSTVRAVAVKPGYLDSKVGTHTYIFLSDVKAQSPYGQAPGPNWPTGSVNGQVIDYGMDPDIINDARYKYIIDSALLDIPTISLVTDLKNLFDPATGIYVNAAQRGRAWERPTSVELINSDGSEGFQIDAGMRMRGGYSRYGDNPKHALRLFFRDQYGGVLKFPLFGDEGVDEFDCVDLRTSMNYSWSFAGDSKNTFVRDEFSRVLQGAEGAPYTRSRYYHLYINGQYWGLFETQERPESSYAESYFGGDKDDYDVVKVVYGSYVIEATDGTLDAYQRLWEEAGAGLETHLAYYKVQGLNTDGTRNPAYERLVDIDNVIDYMLNTFYVGDCDGPISNFLGNGNPNNYYAIYNRNDPDGFKYFRHDAEHTLGTLDWCNDRTGPYPAGQQFQHFNPQWLHQQLVAHPDYRMRLADRAHKYFVLSQGQMTPSVCAQRITNLANQINLAIVGESARWGDAKTHPALNRDSHWRPAVNWITSSYLPSRTGVVLNQLKAKGWYPGIVAPTLSQAGGQVPSGFSLTMSAPAGVIYWTLDGNDPRLPASLSSGGTVTLMQESAAKKVLVPSVANGGSLLTNVLPDFQVTYYKANIDVGDITAAKSVISNPAYQEQVVNETTRVINYFNTGDLGHYGNDRTFPGITMGVDIDHFVIRATAKVYIPTTGSWTFGVNSDDGFELKLTKGANTYTTSFPNGRSPADTLATFNIASAGIHDLELVFFETWGGSELELFAAKGSFSTWNATDFDLVGDTASGGLQLGENTCWLTSYFNDSSWNDGVFISGKTGGVGYETQTGYEPYISYDVKAKMNPNINDTCYIRIPFNVSTTEFSAMKLKVRYDDGFIVYLNGTEVARKNFTDTPAWNSSASGTNPDASAVVFEEFDISAYLNYLYQGSNILAIHGLNNAGNRSDFLISAELVASQASQGSVSPTAIQYTGPVTLTRTTHVKARVLDLQWSALAEAVFAIGPVKEDLRISEIMYHPEDTNDPNDPNEEFIELKNIGAQTLNLNLVQFTEGIHFTFPIMELASGDFVVVVRNINAFEAQYGTGIKVAGQYTGNLDNAGERIKLADAVGQTILDFKYGDGWREITDGNGFSLTIINPADPNINHWAKKDYWRASVYWGGSPGEDDSGILPNPGDVVINELLAHSHAGNPDWIELHNTTNNPINIGGYFLSDSGSFLKKYKIALGTTIPKNGYLVFYEDTDFHNPSDPGCLVEFALSENGETVYLTSAEGEVLTGYREMEDFGASPTDISFGRYHKLSTGNYNFVLMSAKTPNGDNAYPKVGPIVINEIMYHPDWPEGGLYSNDEYEYVELRNITGSSVTLYDYDVDLPWQFTNGIEYIFSAVSPVTVPAGGYIVAVRNKTAFSWRYPGVPSNKIYGPYSGHLDNAGESLELSQPGDEDELGTRYYIRVDRVNYSDGSHPENCPGEVDLWPIEPDGYGMSLGRLFGQYYGNDPNNWSAISPSPGVSN